MQYRVEVYVQDEWVGNALRFVTEQEAESYGNALLCRWTLPTDYRVVEVEEKEES